MKSIGIKQADGTFYKILEEGTAGTNQLVLTTVQDNQTTVQIDLYRSETESMSDAEYVDTLQIKNLEPHPNGEPDLQLNVSIDENGELHAEVDDPETGKSSQIQVSLITLSPEERDSGIKADAVIEEPLNLDSISSDNEAEVNDMIGPSPNEEEFSFDNIEATTPAPEEAISVSEEASSEPEIDLADFDTIPLPEEPIIEETAIEEPVIEESIIEEPVIEEQPADETAEIFNAQDLDEPPADIDIPVDLNIPEEIPEETNVIEESTSDIFDSEESIPEESVEEPAEENTFEESSSIFDLPDFPIEETPQEETSADDIFDAPVPETSDSNDFDLPDDFDTPPVSDPVPVSDDDDIFADTPQSDGLDFDDLYDKETIKGTPSYDYEEDTKRKIKTPVIICIICAAICIIAALLFLFVIPCKINCRNLKADEKQEKTAVEEPALIIEPEEVPEPPAPVEAKENEIVVAVAPQAVVPETPAPKKEKPADIRYKIKWGDTLWDIADAYYKNPWRYKMLARYNGIRNPNLIISGTYIYIPAE